MNKFKFSKIDILNLVIIIVWIILLLLNWITYFRLKYFLIILIFIIVYRILINKLEISNLFIKNSIMLKILIIFNKYRNPVLLLLIKLDLCMYKCIVYYNNKFLNFVIYILYLLIINPIKIFYYKIFKMLWIWKESKIQNIVLNRMLGLVLSVLIFANVIMYIKNTYNLNIIMIIYIYCLIISILCEVIETRGNKWLNIFLVNNISTKSIVLSRLEVNLLSIILKKNNINELFIYMDQQIINKIEKFQIGYTYYIIDSLKNFERKPNYWTYFDLQYKLDIYLALRIDTYIFFKYYEWEVPDMDDRNIMRVSAAYDKNKLKKIYEYDYEVFKVLLFLYWDLEYYLEDIDYVKSSLKVDLSDITFLSIKFNNSFKSEIQFLDRIKYKDSNVFWDLKFFDDILKYDVYSGLKNSNMKYIRDKFYNMVSDDEINTLKEVQSISIDPLYYESYIESWYNEWYSEINIDLSLKYKSKIKHLDLEHQFLVKLLEL